MTSVTSTSMLAHNSIIEYCTTISEDTTELRTHINQLTLSDLLYAHGNEETLLFITVNLSKYHSIDKCCLVMSLLFSQALSVDPEGTQTDNLLFTKNKQGISLLENILILDSTTTINDNSFATIGDIFFNYLYSYLQKIPFVVSQQYIERLSINHSTLYNAFKCNHPSNLEHYLECIHLIIKKNPLIIPTYKAIFFDIINQRRLFDHLIPHRYDVIAHFFKELNYLKKINILNTIEHINLLTNHPKFHQGFSPFFELVINNDIKKINLYVRELNTILPPKDFVHYLLQKNSSNVTVLHKGINNGGFHSEASIDTARFFINLLDPIYFSIQDSLKLIDGDKNNPALKCVRTQKNFEFINHLICQKREKLIHLRDQALDQNNNIPLRLQFTHSTNKQLFGEKQPPIAPGYSTL